MMRQVLLTIGALMALIVLITAGTTPVSPSDRVSAESNVAELLFEAGEAQPDHFLSYDEADVKRGYELIHNGRTRKANGKRSKSISKFYSCTSCHNVQREDPNLTTVDPDARLAYAMDNQLPYLQGSTFWGIVNRETWYNDDYVLKYGDLVKDAEHSLEESIQLCAEYCAQGRRLEAWEINSILAYYWTLQLKVADLDLPDEDLSRLEKARAQGNDEQVIAVLKAAYSQKSPATFSKVPDDKTEGYDYQGRPELGKAIYELSCQHCHKPYGVSDLVLDDAKYSFEWLRKNMTDHSQLSIYHIIREGTYSEKGHKEYMPLYTLEKMPHHQLEDLRSYIEQEASR
ncbi:MAG: c-type cytochrome [Bacteroidota bacterium]